jgi:hypothetical protein
MLLVLLGITQANQTMILNSDYIMNLQFIILNLKERQIVLIHLQKSLTRIIIIFIYFLRVVLMVYMIVINH